MKHKINHLIVLIILLFQFPNIIAQTTFEWETATDNGDNVTEIIDGITATFSGLPDITITDCAGCFGSTNNLVVSDGTTDGMNVTFTFSEPVIVNSILAIDGNSANIDYTFTPTGGTNSPVVASLINGSLSVDLNWTEITSFTVTSSGSLFAFDNLTINDESLSSSNFEISNIIFFPNPVKDVLFLQNKEDLIQVSVYNNLGQLIIETNQAKINFESVSKGTYILKIQTTEGLQNVKIVKE